MVLLLSAVLLVAAPGLLLAYAGWLRVPARPPAGRRPPAPALLPEVDVVVAVHDEARLIDAKLRDLAALEYPGDRIRFWIVDGGSSDDTPEVVMARVAGDSRFRLLRVARHNKTAQLNAALRRVAGDWVMVTDADGRMAPDTLQRLVAAADGAGDVGVVGSRVAPAPAHPLERLHWQLHNRILEAEHRRGSAGIVAGPCYLFRRRLLTEFPGDVVADDVHVACVAAVAGLRVGLSGAPVTEVRAPTTLAALVRHKLRKADAYLREIFRFLPRVHRMASPMREVFLWRAALLVGAPPLASLGLLGLLVAGSPEAAVGLGHGTVAAAALIGLAAVVRHPVTDALRLLLLATLLAAVWLAALVAHPFSQRTASFTKLPGPVGSGPA
jgi:cellulose synthase/poly-beta-1,6-N-acetylglucosamine synthase-like glycosyltransferase